jgi:hypothetical protein
MGLLFTRAFSVSTNGRYWWSYKHANNVWFFVMFLGIVSPHLISDDSSGLYKLPVATKFF